MTHAKAYPPPTPLKQVATPWVSDATNGVLVLSREIRAIEVTGLSFRGEFSKLRLRLANSESVTALRSVRADAEALAVRVDDGDDLRKDVAGLIERVAAKITRASS